MKNVWKRTLSMFLAIVMILGNVPVNALAMDVEEDVPCDHANAQIVDLVDATCDDDGWAEWLCLDCDEEWQESISAAGHSYESADIGTALVYTCARCGDSYEEAKQEPVEEPAEEPVEEPEEEDYDEAYLSEEEAPAMFSLRSAANDTLEGVSWIDADADTTVLDLLGIAAKGGIRDAVLRAVGKYGEDYTVYATIDNTTLNVADPKQLYQNQAKAEQLVEEMRDSVDQDSYIVFNMVSNDGGEDYDAKIRFRSFKTLESADIRVECLDHETCNHRELVYGVKTAPAGMQKQIEELFKARLRVNGLSMEELDTLEQCITYNITFKTFMLPTPGAADRVYSDIVTATITEGMTGKQKTITGGTVIMRNTCEEITINYVDEIHAENNYSFTQYEGLTMPKPAEPHCEYCKFLGWDKDVANKVPYFEDAETSRVITYTASTESWEAGEDEHTPGEVSANGTRDNIDDRHQKFVVNYYSDGEKVDTREVAYGAYLTHITKDELAEAEITKEGSVFKQWKHMGGQKGFIIKSNAAYEAVWEKVWTITYNYNDDGATPNKVEYLKEGSAIPLPTPTRNGYQFNGWTLEDGSDVPAKATSDLALKANWLKQSKITFTDGVADEVVFADIVRTVLENETIEFPADPKRTGYKFNGWKLSDGSDVPEMTGEDLTIQATWLKWITYTFTDGVEGEEIFADFTRTVLEGNTIGNVVVPAQREKYLFTGWELSENNTYVAIWEALPEKIVLYTITYTDGKNGEVFAPFTVQVVEGAPIEHPNAPELSGWAFVEWVYAGEGEAPTTAVADATFKAKLTKIHTITYTDGVEGEEIFASFTKEFLDQEQIKHPGVPAQRDGYAFDKWVRKDKTTPETATEDGEYYATWLQWITYTFTDGVKGDNIFDDFTMTIKEGQTADPAVPAQREGYTFAGWVSVGNNTFEAKWNQNQITITYIQKLGNVEYNYTGTAQNANGDEDYEPYTDTNTNKKKILGWYPCVEINEQKYIKLVSTSTFSRSRSVDDIVNADDTEEEDYVIYVDGIPHVPVDKIHDYTRKHRMPDPIDPATYAFTEDTILYLVEVPDVDNNDVIDGMYELGANGEAVKDENGNFVFAARSRSAIYKYYKRVNGTLVPLNTLMWIDDTTSVFDADALNSEKHVYPEKDGDGVIFDEWKRLEDKTEVNDTETVYTYWIEGIVHADVNNNDVRDDIYETVGVMARVNGAKYVNYDKLESGAVSITLSVPDEEKYEPAMSGSTFVMNTQSDNNVTVTVTSDVAKGYFIKEINFNAFYDGDVTASMTATYVSDDMWVVELAECNENLDGSREYYLRIDLEKLETNVTDLVIDPNVAGSDEFSEKRVYGAALQYPAHVNANTKITYVAREATETQKAVSIQPLFQWLRDNFGDTVMDTVDSYLDTALEEYGLDGAMGKENGKTVLYVNMDKVTKTLDESVSRMVTAQDIANKHVNAFIKDLIADLKTDPAAYDTTMEDMILDIATLLSDITTEVNDLAEIRPFGFSATGAGTINETVEITVNGRSLYTGAVTVKDNRAATNLSKKSITVPYGGSVAGKINETMGVNSLSMPVSYEGQPATTYTDVGVAFYGSQANKPAMTTVDVVISRLEATSLVPSFIQKEHNQDYTGANNPDPVVKVKGVVHNNVDVISIITGIDMSSLDMDVMLSLDAPVNFKNINPVAWVKLPNNLLNMLDMANSLDVDLGELAGDKVDPELLELVDEYLTTNKVERTLDEALDLVKKLMPASYSQVSEMLDIIAKTSEGEMKVIFGGGYPENPGVYLNMGIVADPNYVHGANTDTETGKDYGLILNGPVLTKHNNGIQLVSDELPNVNHNVYTFDNDGNTHALKVEGYENAEIYYYGVNTDLSIHYKNAGKMAPSIAGMYLVSAYVIEGEEGNQRMLSDMAVLLIGVERSITSVEDITVVHTGGEFGIIPETTNEMENKKVGRTTISGKVYDADNANLSDLRGEINIDLPASLDNLWESAVGYLESEFAQLKPLPNEIHDENVKLSPEVTIAFLNWCKTKNKNHELGTVTTGMEMALNQLIAAVNELDERTDITITFKNNATYHDAGSYLYYTIVTDSGFIPSADRGILTIVGETIDGDGITIETLTYNGKAQFPKVTMPDGITFEVIGDEQINAGEYKLTVKGTGNYSGEITLTWEISPAPLTIKAKDCEIFDGEELRDDGVEYEGFVNGETEAVLGGELKITPVKEENGLNYQLVPSGLKSNNYKIAFENGTLTVKQPETVDLEVTIDGKESATILMYSNSEEIEKLLTVTVKDSEGNVIEDENLAPMVTFTDAAGNSVEYTFALNNAGTYIVTPNLDQNPEYAVNETTVATLVVVNSAAAVVNGKTEETVAFGTKEESVKITVVTTDADGKPTEIELSGITYTIVNADGNPVEPDKDEAGNVTKTALAKALEKVGTYTIKPVAPAGIAEENIKPATLKVGISDGQIKSGGLTLSTEGVVYMEYILNITGFDDIDLEKAGGVVVWTGTEKPAVDDLVVGAENCENYQNMYWSDMFNAWTVTSPGINAKNYGDWVYMRAYIEVADGVYVYGPRAYSSPEYYCDTILNGNYATKLKELCASLLRYGSYAQQYFDYKLEALVDAGWDLTAYNIDFSDSMIDAIEASNSVKNATLTGKRENVGSAFATLSLEGAIVMEVIYPNITVEDIVSAEMLVWTEEDYRNASTLAYEAKTYSYKIPLQKGSLMGMQGYIASSKHIPAKEIGDTLYISAHVVAKDGTVYRSGITRTNPDYYIDNTKNSSNLEIANVVKALAVYSEKARAYFGYYN